MLSSAFLVVVIANSGIAVRDEKATPFIQSSSLLDEKATPFIQSTLSDSSTDVDSALRARYFFPRDSKGKPTRFSPTDISDSHDNVVQSYTDKGPYRFLKHLSRGSFGSEYWLAKDKNAEERVIKVSKLRTEQSEDERAFLNGEVRVSKLLKNKKSPYVVNVIDVFSKLFNHTIASHERVFIVMEHQPYETLMQVSLKGPISSILLKDIFWKILSGLDHIHKHQVSHRNLNPETVRLMADGSVKIADFSVASDVLVHKTPVHSGFPSPELKGRLTYTGPAVDVFAFGAMLYWMITGQFAYHKQDPPNVDRNILDIIAMTQLPEKDRVQIPKLKQLFGAHTVKLPNSDPDAIRKSLTQPGIEVPMPPKRSAPEVTTRVESNHHPDSTPGHHQSRGHSSQKDSPGAQAPSKPVGTLQPHAPSSAAVVRPSKDMASRTAGSHTSAQHFVQEGPPPSVAIPKHLVEMKEKRAPGLGDIVIARPSTPTQHGQSGGHKSSKSGRSLSRTSR